MIHSICFDIGGTKTATGLISSCGTDIRLLNQVPTQPGLTSFPAFFSHEVKQVEAFSRKNNITLSNTIMLSLPGNFEPGNTIFFKEGSGLQLLKRGEGYPSKSINKWLFSELDRDYKLFAINDAKAQALGALLQNKGMIKLHSMILYIGPGTGLGGAIIKVGESVNHTSFITDGHIYDFLIDINGNHVMAEDILSGRGVFEHLNMDAKALNDQLNGQSSPHDYVTLMGDVCVGIVKAIKEGRVIKKFDTWLAHECEEVKTINTVILGGSLGTKGMIGQSLRLRLEAIGVTVIQDQNPVLNAFIGLSAAIRKSDN
jgi:predicted NBD/HSP70 family sugar kinase